MLIKDEVVPISIKNKRRKKKETDWSYYGKKWKEIYNREKKIARSS